MEALEKELASERAKKEFPTASISEKPSSLSKKETLDNKSGGGDMLKEVSWNAFNMKIWL